MTPTAFLSASRVSDGGADPGSVDELVDLVVTELEVAPRPKRSPIRQQIADVQEPPALMRELGPADLVPAQAV